MSATTPWTYQVMKERSMALTALFETSTAAPECFGVVAGNFDGMGMSFGALQFNFGTGNLQPIFAYLIDNHPDVVKTAFNYSSNPSYYNTFVDVIKNKTKAQQISWADSISNPANKHNIISPWKGFFNALGVTQECIDRQIAAAEWYWNQAKIWFDEYKVLPPAPNMFSRRAYALFFDIAVQNGGISATTKAQIVEAFNNINTAGKTAEQIETEKMIIIANKRADAVTSSFQNIVRERKLAIANGSGYVYNGTLYVDTSVYELTLEEAFPVELKQHSAGYFQYLTAAGRVEDADSAIGTTLSSSNYPVNFTTMANAGAEFVYMRVTSGITTNDSQFTLSNVNAARNAGLKVGFWHNANPSNAAHSGNGKTIAGAEAEANAFCDRIQAVMGTDYGDLLPALFWLDSGATWANDDEAYNWIEAFNNVVKARLGRNIILNTGYYYVDGNITGASTLHHSAKGGIGNIVPLWLAATAPDLVGTSYPNYNFTRFGGFPEDKWTIWQYTTTGTASTYGVAGTNVILNYMDNLGLNTAPVKPTGLITTAGDTKVTLVWDKSQNINVLGYKIYKNGTLVATIHGINNSTYEVTGLVNGVEYDFTVSAFTQWQESPQSDVVSATPFSSTPNASFPYHPEIARDEVITGFYTFKGGVVNYGKKLNDSINTSGATRYVHLARVWLAAGANGAWKRNFFNMSIFISGDVIVFGEFEGLVYSQENNTTYAGTMCVAYSKHRYSWTAGSMGVTAVKSTGADGTAIVDFYVTLPNNGNVYAATNIAFADTNCTIEINPSTTSLASLPSVSDTFTYNDVLYTIQSNNTGSTFKVYTIVDPT